MIIDENDPPPILKQIKADDLLKGWAIPHTEALGMEFVRIRRREAVGRVPYRDDLIGDAQTGVIHGGVVTTLLDSVSGMAVYATSETLRMFATLDLRIDYQRPAEPGQAILGKATCEKLGKMIAFVRGVAYEHDPADPIAVSQGVFMAIDGDRGSDGAKK